MKAIPFLRVNTVSYAQRWNEITIINDLRTLERSGVWSLESGSLSEESENVKVVILIGRVFCTKESLCHALHTFIFSGEGDFFSDDASEMTNRTSFTSSDIY
jgi:hypothetical protein